MAYQVIIQPNARKSLRKIPDRDRARILAAITGLKSDPFAGKKLEGEYAGDYSLRVWPYRVVYKVLKKELIVLVVKIGQRGGVY